MESARPVVIVFVLAGEKHVDAKKRIQETRVYRRPL